MFRVLPSMMRTTRNMSSTVWKINSFHTSSIFYKDKPKKSNLKTKQVKTSTSDKEKETPAFCSISEAEDLETIKKELGNEELTDILVSHILGMDIKVFKIALEHNVTVSKGSVGYIPKAVLPKNLPEEIKVGKYSVAEDEVIKLNWNRLVEELELKDNEEIVIKEVFKNSNKEKDLGMKRNVLGYFLSQGLSKVRLATDVYQRARTILCATKGEFTNEEDKLILEGGKEGKSWSALAKQLGRTSHITVLDRYTMLVGNYKHGPFTVIEDELILREVFAVNKNILVDKNITVENWKIIGEKLQRPYRAVSERWRKKLEPMLHRYHAGTLDKDVREVLINHLVKNKLNYTQEIDWSELAKLPKFAGTTPAYLSRVYSTLREATGKKYPELGEVKLDTGAIQMYLHRREKIHQTSKTIVEHQEKMIAYYLSNILKK